MHIIPYVISCYITIFRSKEIYFSFLVKSKMDERQPTPRKDIATAPKSGRDSKAVAKFLNIERYVFYWVKLRGYATWPAVVEQQEGASLYRVHFFGDRRIGFVSRSCFVSAFREGFIAFEKGPKSNVKLVKAVKEASLMYLNQSKHLRSKCCVCEM